MDLKRKDDWHVHLTVQPRNHEDASRYAATAAAMGMKPIVMDNLLNNTDPKRLSSYRELIPSLKPRGELGEALIVMHEAAKVWAMYGWIVTRMKLEGRTRTEDALYCESHMEAGGRGAFDGWAHSYSLVSGKQWLTVRAMGHVAPTRMLGTVVEWCVYDSDVRRDNAWLRSWGALS